MPIERDDGTGCGFDVGAVVQQGIFQRLQLFAQAVAFLLQGVCLVLVVGFHRSIHRFANGLHLFLQLLHALRFTLVGGAAFPWRTVEGLQIGISGAGRGIHPCPTLGADGSGMFIQLTAHQSFQQRGIGQIHPGIAFGKQVAADATACGLVGVQPDEPHQRMLGIYLTFGQTVAQGMRAALPFRGIVERSFLHCVIVGDGKGH